MAVDDFYSGKMLRCPSCRKFVIVPTDHDGAAFYPRFEIHTSRLNLTLAKKSDWRALHEIYRDSRNYCYEISSPDTEKETLDKIKRSLFPARFAKSGILLFRISRKEDNAVLGAISVSFRLPYYSVDLGFMVGQDFQGQGYGSEAIAAISEFLLNQIGVEKISAMADSNNAPCRAVLEKVGFKQEGFLKKFFFHPDRGWLDSPLYALFRQSSAD